MIVNCVFEGGHLQRLTRFIQSGIRMGTTSHLVEIQDVIGPSWI